MKLPRPARRRPRIEIIPMIDAIFFLLVFFIFSTLSMVHMKGMNMAVPRPVDAPPDATNIDDNKLVITVTAQGAYLLNGETIAPGSLAQRLCARSKSNPQTVVILNVDPTRTTQDLIRLVDIINRVSLADGKTMPVLVATGRIDAWGHALPEE